MDCRCLISAHRSKILLQLLGNQPRQLEMTVVPDSGSVYIEYVRS